MFYSRIPSSCTRWCTQRISSVSLIGFAVLLCLALWPYHPSLTSRQSTSSISSSSSSSSVDGKHPRGHGKTNYAQFVLAFYTIACHLLGFTFPLRLCWSSWSLTQRLKAAGALQLQQMPAPSQGCPKEHWKTSDSGYESSNSSAPLSPSSELRGGSAFEKGEYDDLILHTIILPNYKEDMDTLKETLDVLASHSQAVSSYEVSSQLSIDEY